MEEFSMKPSTRALKDKLQKERITEVLKHKIPNYDEFMRVYNDLFASNEESSIKPLNDQSQVSRMFSKFNVERRDGTYKIIDTLPKEDFLLKKYASKYITKIADLSDFSASIISVDKGKEEFVCEAIQNKFNFKQTSIIPAYGSIVLIGDVSEIEEFKEIMPIFVKKKTRKE